MDKYYETEGVVMRDHRVYFSDEIDGVDSLDDVQGDETVDDTKSKFQNEGGVRVNDDDEVKV
ncbi:hypothetical protein MTR_5g061810 [Medicago truncatula]|uniref:Uncharacterized protein n=1 Tax=Medicago truncatula TaxID=3880 RepID=G7KA18_MEDTR|nr:hypothetical protein MTR_5g061810 [Medicago truncatula]